MTGLVATYIAFGAYTFVMFEADYRRIVSPNIIQYFAFFLLIAFLWPFAYWMITRREQ